MSQAVRRALPVLITLAVIIALGYPLAFVFGLPLAQRDMEDLRKWVRGHYVAPPPAEIGDARDLTFPDAPEQGVLVWREAPLDVPFRREGAKVALEAAADVPLVAWQGPLERVAPRIHRLPDPASSDDPRLAVYLGDVLAARGAVDAREVPDGQRTRFTMPGADGPVLLDGRLLDADAYTEEGDAVELAEAAPFGSHLRRVRGDYAVLDASQGLLAFRAEPAGEVRAAEAVLRLAERLEGAVDGRNRRFRAGRERLVESDPQRALYLDARPLDGGAGRAEERADGQRRSFTFEHPSGVVTVDGEAVPSEDLQRDGRTVTLAEPPPRNARVRQHRDYLLEDAATGTFLFAQPPEPGEVPWALSYTVHARPGCGETLIACFFALPQHPVPFPHWIAQRIGPFVQKHPITDERNVLRATLYTTLGTGAALLLGAAVGVLLAVLFVLLRPVERALLPWVVASQTVPIIALVPVLLLVLGNFGITVQSSLLPTALIGAYIAFFPVVVGTVKGLRSVHPLALDLMRSYAATPAQVFLKVRFPAAVPFLFTSLKLGTAAALVGALVAEVESNNRRGLGFQILGQVQSGNVADVWILLIVSSLLGIGLVALIGLAERLLAPWKRA